MFNGEERIILTVTVFVYFIFLFVLALYMNRKTKTYEDYNVAGRSVGLFPIMLTFIGTGVGGSTLLGYMENGYRLGMGEQWINITMLFSIIIFASFLLKRVRKLGEVHNMVTLGDYTALRYGEKARIPTVISVLFSYCAMTGMQFVAIGTILNLIIGLDMTLGIVLGWLILTLKTYLGGLKAVIWQDVFHGTIQTLGIVILFVVVVVAAGGWELIAENARSMNEESMISILNIETSEIFVYLLTLGVYQFIRQDLWQRVWAAKSMETARNGYWISMIIAIGLAALVVAIGVFSRYGLNLEGVDPALIYYGVIGELFPFSLVVVMIVVLLATVISSADSFFIAGSSSIANDLIRPNVKQSDNKKMLAYSKISCVNCIGYCSCIFFGDSGISEPHGNRDCHVSFRIARTGFVWTVLEKSNEACGACFHVGWTAYGRHLAGFRTSFWLASYFYRVTYIYRHIVGCYVLYQK